MSYTQFTLEERKYLQKLLSEGLSLRKAAAVLERSPSSVSREVKRNRSKYRPHRKPDNPYWYNHWRTQILYTQRRRQSVRRAIQPGTETWEYMVTRLREHWSPEAICGRRKLTHPNEEPLHYSTIYRYIAKGYFPQISRKTNFQRRGKRIQTKNANYNTIQPDRIIPEWPE